MTIPMLQGRNIVCISSIDWEFIWQGHQQIMSGLAEQGNRVLFIENTGVRPPTWKDLPRLKRRLANWWRGTKGFRRYRENLFIYSPLVLPFPYSRVARTINRLVVGRSLKSWMQAMEFSRPILWTFLPTPFALDLIRALDPKVTVYYCIDNIAESSPRAKRITASEVEVLRRSDLVFVTSQDLYSYARRYNPRVEIFPFGVDLEYFEKVRALSEETAIPEEIRPIPRPVVGYVGGIHRWLDQSLIVEVAGKLPRVNFVFVGPIQTDVSRLRRLANVYLLGERSHKEIPYYIRAFDAGLIPYVISRYTDNVYPTKLNEYLAMGKPVVSTELKEIAIFNRLNGNLVRVGTSSAEFASGIEEAVTRDGEELWFRRIAVAGQNSWQKRIERMSKLIEERLELVEQATEGRWEERLLAFYRGSRRRIAAAAGGFLFLYLLIFYTPIVWSLAEPLKLVDPPGSSDAIVVFAGGVGESGLAGEGYQERAKHAADLYHSRHARHIIFSSGYSYLLKEAEMMKSFAVSLGVPAEAIVLEEKAANTHENVRFVTEILERNGWRTILLVSSPYHMRRASLTFRRVAPRISVTHSPSGSRFYNHALGASAPQIRAILQEYAAIAYYWWKNRI